MRCKSIYKKGVLYGVSKSEQICITTTTSSSEEESTDSFIDEEEMLNEQQQETKCEN